MTDNPLFIRVLRFGGSQNTPKTGYLIAVFSKIKVRLKALSERLKGIPEGVI